LLWLGTSSCVKQKINFFQREFPLQANY
jgi:hypothetical protein